MASPTNSENNHKAGTLNGRNPLLIVGGFIILGLALSLLIFGGSLFGGSETAVADPNGSILQQIPPLAANDETNPVQLPSSGGPLEVGALAYDFALDDVAGNPIRLSELTGSPVIVNFWATWCAPCRIEMPELEAAYQAYRDEGLVILALDQQEAGEDVANFFEELGLNFTAVLDSEGTVSAQYGVASILPTTFFINGAGEITAIHRGPMVQSQIDGYLAETIPVTE